jgi:biopolymer transport protein ExbB
MAQWQAGQREAAVAAARGARGVRMRVLDAVLSAQLQRSDAPDWAEEMGRQAALTELATLGRFMRVLEAVVQAAPMLGLLGTVVGMIDAFGALAQSTGGVDPALLAGGIWTALTTTAIGLAIALVFYFVAIWLEGRIETERQGLEVLLSAAVHGQPPRAG